MSRVPFEQVVMEQYGMTIPELKERALSDSFVFGKGIAGYTRLGDMHKLLCKSLDDPDVQDIGAVMPRASSSSLPRTPWRIYGSVPWQPRSGAFVIW